jgi:hypothetical protein
LGIAWQVQEYQCSVSEIFRGDAKWLHGRDNCFVCIVAAPGDETILLIVAGAPLLSKWLRTRPWMKSLGISDNW